MHDPFVVAFEIRRPWPRRDRSHDSTRPHHPDRVFPRWRFKLHHDCLTCSDEERAAHAGRRIFPWYRPSSWTPFWTVAGRGFYWPSLVTVWHREPRGHDSGEVCRHWRTDATGERRRYSNAWRFHVHHWKIQVRPLQDLRRWALTRCAWCGGRDRKDDPVNISHSWDGPRERWWRGEPGLYHRDCSSVSSAHRACTCEDPLLPYDRWGTCTRCGRFRAFGRKPPYVETDRLLATIPVGHRDPAVYALAERAWRLARAEAEH